MFFADFGRGRRGGTPMSKSDIIIAVKESPFAVELDDTDIRKIADEVCHRYRLNRTKGGE